MGEETSSDAEAETFAKTEAPNRWRFMVDAAEAAGGPCVGSLRLSFVPGRRSRSRSMRCGRRGPRKGVSSARVRCGRCWLVHRVRRTSVGRGSCELAPATETTRRTWPRDGGIERARPTSVVPSEPSFSRAGSLVGAIVSILWLDLARLNGAGRSAGGKGVRLGSVWPLRLPAFPPRAGPGTAVFVDQLDSGRLNGLSHLPGVLGIGANDTHAGFHPFHRRQPDAGSLSEVVLAPTQQAASGAHLTGSKHLYRQPPSCAHGPIRVSRV